MKNKLKLVLFLLCSIIITSCGPSNKELSESNLKAVNSAINSYLAMNPNAVRYDINNVKLISEFLDEGINTKEKLQIDGFDIIIREGKATYPPFEEVDIETLEGKVMTAVEKHLIMANKKTNPFYYSIKVTNINLLPESKNKFKGVLLYLLKNKDLNGNIPEKGTVCDLNIIVTCEGDKFVWEIGMPTLEF